MLGADLICGFERRGCSFTFGRVNGFRLADFLECIIEKVRSKRLIGHEGTATIWKFRELNYFAQKAVHLRVAGC